MFEKQFKESQNQDNNAPQAQKPSNTNGFEETEEVNYTVKSTQNNPKTHAKNTTQNHENESVKTLMDSLFTQRQNANQNEQEYNQTPPPHQEPTPETDPDFFYKKPNNQQQNQETDREINDEDFDFEEVDFDAETEDEPIEIDDAVIEGFVDMTVDYIDIYIPMFLRWLNEIEGDDKYQAHKKSIENIKKYATIYAQENKHLVLDLTNGQKLLLAIATAYGIPTIQGLIHRSPQMLVYISNFFSRTNKTTYHNPTKPENPVTFTKCLHAQCDELIESGQGVPRSSKSNPHLVGRFCSQNHFLKYSNENDLIGKKARK